MRKRCGSGCELEREQMSQIYEIFCINCREHLQIASRGSGLSGIHIWWKKEYGFALSMFVNIHKGHQLVFDSFEDTFSWKGSDDPPIDRYDTSVFSIVSAMEEHEEISERLLALYGTTKEDVISEMNIEIKERTYPPIRLERTVWIDGKLYYH